MSHIVFAVLLLLVSCIILHSVTINAAPADDSYSIFSVLEDASIAGGIRCRISVVNMTRRGFEPKLGNCNVLF